MIAQKGKLLNGLTTLPQQHRMYSTPSNPPTQEHATPQRSVGCLQYPLLPAKYIVCMPPRSDSFPVHVNRNGCQ